MERTTKTETERRETKTAAQPMSLDELRARWAKRPDDKTRRAPLTLDRSSRHLMCAPQE